MREGSLDAPQRHPLDWKSQDFYDHDNLFNELERVFDICHGCRRCFNLCNSFPTLFDLVDDSPTMEIDGVNKDDYWDVVDNCYLCDLCFMTKCPYVPPHEWAVDFPHLMLRAKIAGNKIGRPKFRDKLLSSTNLLGKVSSVPVMFHAANAAMDFKPARALLEKTLGVHRDAKLPKYTSGSVQRKLAKHQSVNSSAVGSQGGADNDLAAGRSSAEKVALFSTCYGQYNRPQMNADMIAVFEHNRIAVQVVNGDVCCGMPKLEIGDMHAVERLKNKNIPVLAQLVRDGAQIITPIPSCSLMFRQELPLLFPHDEDVLLVQSAVRDPFEFLVMLVKDGLLNADFKNTLGSVLYHVACHQRVQNVGPKTREILEMIPDTELTVVERCSGHDGTYAVKQEYYEFAKKIVRPIANQVKKLNPDYVTSDCVLAADHIANHSGIDSLEPKHPISLLRIAYGI